MRYKSFLLYAMFVVLINSCKKDDDIVFSDTPAERIDKTLTALNSVLVEPNYWTANVFTGAGNGYSFYLDFEGNNRVKMLSDINNTTSTVINESSYSIKWLQQPTLLFDTYNYIHWLVDPVPGTNGINGSAGIGLKSDFEFGLTALTVDSLNADPAKTMSLITIGRYNETPVTFRKVSAVESNYWTSGGINRFMNTIAAINNDNFILFTLQSGAKLQMGLNFTNKILSLAWLDASKNIISVQTPFAFQMNRFDLRDTLNIDGKKITYIVYDTTQKIFTGVDINNNNLLGAASVTAGIPFYLLFGSAITNIVVPNTTTYPGWGSEFVTQRATAASGVATYSVSGVQLSLSTITLMNINKVSKSFTIRVVTPYGTNSLNLDYPYTYTFTSDGVFKFTAGTPASSNASALAGVLAPLLANRISADHFTLDYFINTISHQKMAQFKSVEHPNFIFTGTF